MTDTLNHLFEIDQEVFLWLNGMHNSFWDNIMLFVTNKFTWIPMYVLMLYGIVKKLGRDSIGIILAILAAVALADYIASGLFKPYFMRPRPCHDPVIGSLVHVVAGCGGPFGFVSSHASTSFAIVTSALLLPSRSIKGIKFLCLWALVYAYSRVYVGVHYPLDIVFGALIGLITGYFSYLLYRIIEQRR